MSGVMDLIVAAGGLGADLETIQKALVIVAASELQGLTDEVAIRRRAQQVCSQDTPLYEDAVLLRSPDVDVVLGGLLIHYVRARLADHQKSWHAAEELVAKGVAALVRYQQLLGAIAAPAETVILGGVSRRVSRLDFTAKEADILRSDLMKAMWREGLRDAVLDELGRSNWAVRRVLLPLTDDASGDQIMSMLRAVKSIGEVFGRLLNERAEASE